MKKILIVEDNKDLYEMYSMIFKKEGYDVLVSTDGSDALLEVVDFEPDFVLLDIMMPGVNGYDFLEGLTTELEEIGGHRPIIAVNSNLNGDNDMVKSFELGADYYFKKSDYTPSELLVKVKEILNS